MAEPSRIYGVSLVKLGFAALMVNTRMWAYSPATSISQCSTAPSCSMEKWDSHCPAPGEAGLLYSSNPFGLVQIQCSS